MSAGAFIETKYEADNGDIYSIRVQPDTLTAALGAPNAAPAGAVTQPLFATARKSKRAYGMGARTARVRFTGAVPTGYLAGSILTIPVLTLAVYNGLNKTTTGLTYLASPVQFVGKTAQSEK